MREVGWAHFMSPAKGDEPFSKKEARMMVVALGSSLQTVERETIRRTLAEVINHREQAATLLCCYIADSAHSTIIKTKNTASEINTHYYGF